MEKIGKKKLPLFYVWYSSMGKNTEVTVTKGVLRHLLIRRTRLWGVLQIVKGMQSFVLPVQVVWICKYGLQDCEKTKQWRWWTTTTKPKQARYGQSETWSTKKKKKNRYKIFYFNNPFTLTFLPSSLTLKWNKYVKSILINQNSFSSIETRKQSKQWSNRQSKQTEYFV